MQVYVIVCSVLFCLLVAAESKCYPQEAKKRLTQIQLEVKKNPTKCLCNETSVVSHKHYNEDACSCFLIPEIGNCNLTCFQDGIDKYKGIITKGHPGKFITSTFSTYAKACAFMPCAGECRNMTSVNATVFWNEVKDVFQQINSINQNKTIQGHTDTV